MSDFDEKLESILSKAFSGFDRLIKAERLSGGASQETYRLNVVINGKEKMLAMRRSAGGEFVDPSPGHPGLAAEAQLMRSALLAGVPEPEIHYVLDRQDDLGDGFVMEWLDGITLGAKVVRDPDLDEIRPTLARRSGEVLAKIHAISLEESGLTACLDAITPAEYVEQTWTRYRDFETAQPMIDYTGRWLIDNLPGEYSPSLVHNDFRNGNIMFDQQGIVAVLDWEVAHIGDPMRDLGWICTNSWRFGRSDLPVGGFGEYEDLFAGYESVSGKEVDRDRVRWWEVFGSFWWAIGCLGMAEHYRSGPDKTVERPAIGRRSSECQVDCVNLLIPGNVELIAPNTDPSSNEMPRMEELLISVRDFLRGEVMGETQGRTNFLARVASNSLDIAIREQVIGSILKEGEVERLNRVVKGDGTLDELRWKLVKELRSQAIELDAPGLEDYLRFTVVNQVAIDQPKYSGLKTAIN